MNDTFGSGSLSAEAAAIFAELRREPADDGYFRRLVADGSPTLDDSLIAVIQAATGQHDVMVLASRILVERDPRRSLDFFPDFVRPAAAARERGAKIFAYAIQFFFGDPSPAAGEFGYSRLRGVDVLGDYARLARHRFAAIRVGAMFGLGDTADLAALDTLASGLTDRRYRVRVAAADAVRRLRHAGPAELILAHPVRHLLVKALSDRHAEVRVAAARALGSLGDHDSLREHSHSLRQEKTELDQILNDQIPPLDKIWPLDDTT